MSTLALWSSPHRPERDDIGPATVSAAVPSNGNFTYTNYVLLRENETRIWLFRIGDRYAYSIAKNQIVYIRY